MRELIRQILREALGVPEGSTESGEMLYNLILLLLVVLLCIQSILYPFTLECSLIFKWVVQ